MEVSSIPAKGLRAKGGGVGIPGRGVTEREPQAAKPTAEQRLPNSLRGKRNF